MLICVCHVCVAGSGPLDVSRVEVRMAGIVAGAISGLLAGLFGTGKPHQGGIEDRIWPGFFLFKPERTL